MPKTPSYYEDSWYYIQNYVNIDEFQIVCLQRKFITDEQGNQQDLVKTDYKCVENNLNEWGIRQRSNFYSIISVYDGKCLNYDPHIDKFYMQECNNNKYEEFTIKDDLICSPIDTEKCLYGYVIVATSIKPKKYQNLTCSIDFARLGIKCCSNQNIKVEYVDTIGNWGIENNELCGIGYTRCPFSVLGYDCCSSLNPKVIRTDKNGKWGMEDGYLCGIGEVTIKPKYYIRNKKTSQCLVTANSDEILLGVCDDTNSIWYIKDNKVISAGNNKCLYVNNSTNAATKECENVNDKMYINDYGAICYVNHKDPNKQLCLNGNDLKFEISNDDDSEWVVKDLNNKIVDFIGSVIINNPNLHIGIIYDQ